MMILVLRIYDTLLIGYPEYVFTFLLFMPEITIEATREARSRCGT